eukprot:COSAG04_NODE_1554_length_6372_cov_3.084808_5_plen_417_part_00
MTHLLHSLLSLNHSLRLVAHRAPRPQVLADVAAFAKYDRNGLDCEIEFQPAGSLAAKTRDFILKLSKAHLAQAVEDSGYGWDDEDRQEELTEESARYLVVRRREDRQLLGFASFAFTVQGGIEDKMEGFPSLLINEINLVPEAQRKGLGRHLVMTLEMIARKQRMTFMLLRLFKGNRPGEAFVGSQLKGFAADSTYVSASAPIRLMQKLLAPADLKKEGIEPPTELAVSPPSSPEDAAEKAAPAAEKEKAAAPIELDEQFKNAIKLTPAPKKAPEPAAVLKLFYSKVGEKKTEAQINDIIEKRMRSAPTWFETLCGKLQKCVSRPVPGMHAAVVCRSLDSGRLRGTGSTGRIRLLCGRRPRPPKRRNRSRSRRSRSRRIRPTTRFSSPRKRLGKRRSTSWPRSSRSSTVASQRPRR